MMVARVTFWFYHEYKVVTATHNIVWDNARRLLDHIDHVAKGYYTCREIDGRWVVDQRWAGMYPRTEHEY